MKRHLLSLFLIISGLAAVSAQCTVDSSALGGPLPVFPPPETPDNPDWGINIPACAGTSFEFTITFAVPDTFNYPGPPALQLPLNYVQLAATGAFTNAPAWLNYACNPTNCKFVKNTLGCVKIFGDVPANAVLDSIDLQIAVTVNVAVFGSIPLTVPSGLGIPGYYRLRIYPIGHSACTSSTDELASVIYKIEASPNPFAAQTTIRVEAISTEVVDFQVVNLLGQTVENRSVKLFPGENRLDFDASDLPEGIYQYTIGNGKGQRAGKLVVAR